MNRYQARIKNIPNIPKRKYLQKRPADSEDMSVRNKRPTVLCNRIPAPSTSVPA